MPLTHIFLICVLFGIAQCQTCYKCGGNTCPPGYTCCGCDPVRSSCVAGSSCPLYPCAAPKENPDPCALSCQTLTPSSCSAVVADASGKTCSWCAATKSCFNPVSSPDACPKDCSIACQDATTTCTADQQCCPLCSQYGSCSPKASTNGGPPLGCPVASCAILDPCNPIGCRSDMTQARCESLATSTGTSCQWCEGGCYNPEMVGNPCLSTTPLTQSCPCKTAAGGVSSYPLRIGAKCLSPDSLCPGETTLPTPCDPCASKDTCPAGQKCCRTCGTSGTCQTSQNGLCPPSMLKCAYSECPLPIPTCTANSCTAPAPTCPPNTYPVGPAVCTALPKEPTTSTSNVGTTATTSILQAMSCQWKIKCIPKCIFDGCSTCKLLPPPPTTTSPDVTTNTVSTAISACVNAPSATTAQKYCQGSTVISSCNYDATNAKCVLNTKVVESTTKCVKDVENPVPPVKPPVPTCPSVDFPCACDFDHGCGLLAVAPTKEVSNLRYLCMPLSDVDFKGKLVTDFDQTIPMSSITVRPPLCATLNTAQPSNGAVGGAASASDAVNNKIAEVGAQLSIHDFDPIFAWCASNLAPPTSPLKDCVVSTISAKCHATTDPNADPKKDIGCTLDHMVQCSGVAPSQADVDGDICKCVQYAMNKISGAEMNGKCKGSLTPSKKRAGQQGSMIMTSTTVNSNSAAGTPAPTGMSTGAIIGIAVAGVVAVVVIVVIIVIFAKKEEQVGDSI